jgi:hypothetical protein
MMVETSQASTQFLTVPQNERMFLLSPPGSPPLGWRQVKEAAPVVDALAERLSRLSDADTFMLDAPSGDAQMPVFQFANDGDANPVVETTRATPRIVFAPDPPAASRSVVDSTIPALPIIMVQDCSDQTATLSTSMPTQNQPTCLTAPRTRMP